MVSKQRSSIVTGWLIFIVIINGLSSLLYLFKQDLVSSDFPHGIQTEMLNALALINLVSLICIYQIFKWKKTGLIGLIVTSSITVSINLYNGLGIGQSLLGLLGIGVLMVLMLVKKNGASAWRLLNQASKS